MHGFHYIQRYVWYSLIEYYNLIISEPPTFHGPFRYPFQSQKSLSWRSFSRLEVSAGARLKKSSYSAKFKNQLVQLNNFSSAHQIVLSIEDRVDVHCWFKPPHKCTQTTLICQLHPYIPIITILAFLSFFF